MDVEIEHPHQHHQTGHKWLDKVLPVSALFVSLISILIAYHHGHVMQNLVTQNERLVEANSRPHLTLMVRNWANEEGRQHLDFTLKNGGVGPAEIRKVEMLLDGKPVASSAELIDRCCGVNTREYNRGVMENTVLIPGETTRFLSFDSRPGLGEDFTKILRAWGQRRITASTCYCSVFSQCWTTSITAQAPPARPVPVQECPEPAISYTS